MLAATCLSEPTAAQDLWANLFATVRVGGLGPNFQQFPQRFEASRVIALYDTNNNGIIDMAAGDPNVMFPFNPIVPNAGRRIGSLFVINPGGAPILNSFCGHYLVYAEMVRNGTTFFLWFAFPDPNLPRRPNCGDWPIDFGAGYYQGSRTAPRNAHHATYVAGSLASNGLFSGTGFDALRFMFNRLPGAMNNPGRVFSQHPTDNFAAFPAALPRFIAAEPGGDPVSTTFVELTQVVIDVPVVLEENWDGQTLFQTNPAYGRSIQGLAGGQAVSAATSSATTLWSSAFSDADNWNTDPSYWKTIQFADVNGDGKADVCGRGEDGIYCALSDGTTFGPTTRWSDAFSNANDWNTGPSFWGTIQFVDVNGDGKADVCGRGTSGIYCALSNGTSFGPVSLWSANFNNEGGWNTDPAYWKTIRFVDVNGDGKADVCGRGIDGILCALSDGVSFGPVTLWSDAFSNANSWNTDPSYWETIQFADLNGDGKADVCGRGTAGVYCALSDGISFGPTTLWADTFSNANGWNTDPSYWRTIQFADLNGDGKADVCGRGTAGVYCALSNVTSFGPVALWSADFSDGNGWSAERFYKTIRLVDVNGDLRADVCGRGRDGIVCAMSSPFRNSFDSSGLRVRNFGDNFNWGSSEAYWGTVQPAKGTRMGGARWCGRGYDGILCSNQ